MDKFTIAIQFRFRVVETGEVYQGFTVQTWPFVPYPGLMVQEVIPGNSLRIIDTSYCARTKVIQLLLESRTVDEQESEKILSLPSWAWELDPESQPSDRGSFQCKIAVDTEGGFWDWLPEEMAKRGFDVNT